MQGVPRTSLPKHRAALILLLAGFECLLFGATIAGWPSIVYVFKEDGVFSHLCEDAGGANLTTEVTVTDPVMTTSLPFSQAQMTSNDSSSSKLWSHSSSEFPRCSAQDRMFSLVFTIAVVFWGAGGVFTGWFFDRYGLLKSRFIAITCGAAGLLMFAWTGSDRYTSYLVFLGSLCIVTASFLSVTTCTHMAILAGAHATTMLAFCVGAASSSVVVFFIVKILHDQGISRKISLTVVAAYWLIVLLYSWVLMPHYKIIEGGDTDGGKELSFPSAEELPSADEQNGITLKTFKALDGETPRISATRSIEPLYKTDPNAKTLWQCVRTLSYLFLNIWFPAIHLACHGFLGMFNPWVIKLTDNDNDEVNRLTNVLAYCQMSALLIGPIAGAIIDFCKRRVKDRGDMTQGIATMPVTFVVSTLAIVLHVCVFVNRVPAAYASTIISEVTRTPMFSCDLAFIGIVYQGQHYGTLFGISHCIACFGNLLQYPLFIWADSSNSYAGMSIFLVVLSVISFCHPIYMVIFRIKGEQKSI